jgi:hypothetical protein
MSDVEAIGVFCPTMTAIFIYIDTKQRVLRCVFARARVFRARADSSQLQRVHGFGGDLCLTLSELGLRTIPTSTT